MDRCDKRNYARRGDICVSIEVLIIGNIRELIIIKQNTDNLLLKAAIVELDSLCLWRKRIKCGEMGQLRLNSI